MTEENLKELKKRLDSAQSEVSELEEAIAALEGKQQKSVSLGDSKLFDYLKNEIEVEASEFSRRQKIEVAERTLKHAKERLVERQKALQEAEKQIEKEEIAALYRAKIEKVIAAQKVYLKELYEFEQLAAQHRTTWMRSGGGEPFVREGIRTRDCFPIFVRSSTDSAHASLLPWYEARKWAEVDDEIVTIFHSSR